MEHFDLKREKTRYSIVTPARNEEAVIHRTIDSMINQTIRPQKWIIINDGSTDRTGEILESYSEKYNWITAIHIEKRVSSYKGIQEKLGMAFAKIDIDQNDFIGKIDADIELSKTYYKNLMRKFYENQKLGIAGGTLFHVVNGKKVIENNPEYHVRGGLKFYRIQCWKDMGGMEFKQGYDTIDEIKAAMFGWETKSFKDIKALHMRPSGQAEGALYWYTAGQLAYMVGYHPLFLFLKSLRDIISVRPRFLGGIAELAGFLISYLKETERSVSDKEVIKFLRKTQMRRLFFRQ